MVQWIALLLVLSELSQIASARNAPAEQQSGSRLPNQDKNSLLSLKEPTVDCNQFKNDLDIIRQLPFPIRFVPAHHIAVESTVTMDENQTFVQEIYLDGEQIVPPSVFCLSKLHQLSVVDTPFADDILPDALANFKELRELFIYNATLVQITELLGTLTDLRYIIFSSCSLTYLPDLSNLHKVWGLDLYNNQLRKLNGPPEVILLNLVNNLFEEIPRLTRNDTLHGLFIGNNPLKDTEAIMSYPNIKHLDISSTGSTFIPATIDKLKNIDFLDISNNKLSHPPTNVLNLVRLKRLNIQNNLFTPAEIKAFRRAFRKARPKAKLIA